MATVTPAGTATERSNLSNVVGVIALLAVIALVYFVARGRDHRIGSEKPAQTAPSQQAEPVPPAPKQ